MEGKSASSVVLRFDLADATRDVKSFRAGWSVFGGLLVALGVGMVIVGMLLLALHYGTSTVSQTGTFLVLAAVGAIVGIAAWPLATEGSEYPTVLTVSDAELTLRAPSGAPNKVYAWADPALVLGLIDRRGLPAIRPDGRPRHKFAIQAGGRGPWTPIPDDAFEAILSRSQRFHLRISRRTERAPGTPGTFEEITIRGPKQSQ